MPPASPTTYGILGLLAVRSWTGYELTQHLRRSLRFVWPSSDGHLYREQNRLVAMGWATVTRESVGGRKRNRYTITPEGELALQAWLRSSPQEPHFEIEGMLRLFHSTHGSSDALLEALETTLASSREMIRELAGYAEEYLEEGGPLWMIEHGQGGPDRRMDWRGREMVPERLHVVALVMDGTTRLLSELARFCEETVTEIRGWTSLTDPGIAVHTRARLEAVRTRATPDRMGPISF